MLGSVCSSLRLHSSGADKLQPLLVGYKKSMCVKHPAIFCTDHYRVLLLVPQVLYTMYVSKLSEQASKKLQLKEQLERKPLNSLLDGFLNSLSPPIADCQNLDLYFFLASWCVILTIQDESKEENIIVMRRKCKCGSNVSIYYKYF